MPAKNNNKKNVRIALTVTVVIFIIGIIAFLTWWFRLIKKTVPPKVENFQNRFTPKTRDELDNDIKSRETFKS